MVALFWLWIGVGCSAVATLSNMRVTALLSVLFLSIGFTSLSLEGMPAYVSSRESTVYHLVGCVYAPKNPTFKFAQEQSAKRTGRTPCPYCLEGIDPSVAYVHHAKTGPQQN